MKKVFAIMAIAGLMVACNNKSDKPENTIDSTHYKDSMNKVMMMNDSINKAQADTMNKMNADTSKSKM
jgi:hypothetical protein